MLNRAGISKTKVIKIYQMILTFDKSQTTAWHIHHEEINNEVKI